MRAFLITFALLAAAAWAGLNALNQLPDPGAPLSTRTGPGIASVKAWGYQLQKINPRQIPAAIDLIVVDLTARDAVAANDIEALRTRPDGTKRIVLCYLSIGEAENYRAYWQRRWATSPPVWLGPENPAWKGNFAVNFWHPEWQGLILAPINRAALPAWKRLLLVLFPQPKPYLDNILEAGFDGVYLDRIDAYEKGLEVRASAQNDMIAFVEAISTYAKKRRPGFLVVPRSVPLRIVNMGAFRGRRRRLSATPVYTRNGRMAYAPRQTAHRSNMQCDSKALIERSHHGDR